MLSALICTHADLEADLGQTMLWRQDVDRHLVGRLVTALREDPSTRGLSIVVIARGDFDPGEIELLESGANAVVRIPVDRGGDERLERLVHVPVRKETRFSVSFHVDAFAAGAGVPEPALALNLSQNGMLMEATSGLTVGEDVVLSFPLGDPPDVRSHGRVVRMATATQFGIEFTDVAPELSTRLHRFLETLEQA